MQNAFSLMRHSNKSFSLSKIELDGWNFRMLICCFYFYIFNIFSGFFFAVIRFGIIIMRCINDDKNTSIHKHVINQRLFSCIKGRSFSWQKHLSFNSINIRFRKKNEWLSPQNFFVIIYQCNFLYFSCISTANTRFTSTSKRSPVAVTSR